MSNINDDKYINLEKKVNEIDSKQKILEERYQCDLENVYDILKKLEHRLVGGGLDSGPVGLITEMRDLKREIGEYTKQTFKIQTTVDEIKSQLIPSQQVIKDIAEIKIKMEGFDRQRDDYNKYKYLTWGALLAAGWIITKVSPFIEKLLP